MEIAMTQDGLLEAGDVVVSDNGILRMSVYCEETGKLMQVSLNFGKLYQDEFKEPTNDETYVCNVCELFDKLGDELKGMM
jgi:hypothetical protein